MLSIYKKYVCYIRDGVQNTLKALANIFKSPRKFLSLTLSVLLILPFLTLPVNASLSLEEMKAKYNQYKKCCPTRAKKIKKEIKVLETLENTKKPTSHLRYETLLPINSDLAFHGGNVYTIAKGSDGTTYVGGSFTLVSPYYGPGIPIDASTGQAQSTFPKIDNGAVYAVAPDGSGGWYIGGTFTAIEGVTRNRLAHISSDGTLDSNWNPNANSTVRTLAVSGSTVYVGGDFTTIGGTTRNRLAAIGTDGTLASWNPNANALVRVLAIDGSTVYVGGDFTTIGGTTRNYSAAIGTNGTLSSTWNPNTNGLIAGLAISGSTVYLGGAFGLAGATTRNYLAAVGTNGTLTSWNPNGSGTVVALAVSGSTVYIAGGFTTIGGTARNNIAAVDTTNGTLTSWNPNANSTVYSVTVSGSTVYLGGGFTTIGGTTRNYLAAIGTNGTLSSWNPNPNASITFNSIAVYGSTVYVGGNFTTIGGTTRNRLAAIGTDGTLSSWNPNANGEVDALAVSGSTVYAAGGFTTIGGTTRNRLAAIGTDGTLASWNPNANSTVQVLVISGSTVYVAGNFTTIGGTTRNYLAAIGTDGTLSSWNPNPNGPIPGNALTVSGSTVYVGGYFTTIGGTTRNRLAAIGTDGTLSSWNPNANSTVRSLAVSGSTVYLGGEFTTIGGTTRNYLAAVGTDGTLSSWNPNANNSVYPLAVSGSTVYAGGNFTTIGGTTRNRLAAIGTDGTLSSWDPNANDYVYGLTVDGSTVYTGGAFTNIGGSVRSKYVTFTNDETAPTLSSAAVNGTSLTLTYNETLNTTSPATSAFTLMGTSATVSSVSISGSVVTLTLGNGGVLNGETVTLDYTVPGSNPIQDSVGNSAAALSSQSVTNNTPDTTAPTLSSAAVNGTSLTLTYNETLNTTSPATSAFTLMGTSATVSSISISGSTVTLTLGNGGVLNGETVTLNYTVPGSNPIQDSAGNSAAALSSQSVTNNTPDTTAPTLSSAAVNGTSLTLTYNETLNTTAPATSAFTLMGTSATVSMVSISGSVVTLTLGNGGVLNGETVTLNYTVPGSNPIQDSAGNSAAALSSQSVTNNTPDTTAPTLSTAAVNGTSLTLTYNETLNTTSPATSAFTLMGTSATVSSVSISGSAVTLTLGNGGVLNGETVTLNYSVPGSNPIQDSAGNSAAALSSQSVTNNTADTTAPTLSSAAVNGTSLTLTYNETLNTTSPATSAFTLMGTSATVSSISISGSTVTLTLGNGGVLNGETVTLNYTVPGSNPIQDSAGNSAAALSSQSVTNNTADTTAPTLSSAAVNGTSLTLTYNETLNTTAPATSAFTLMGTSATVSSVSISGSAVTLTLGNGGVLNGETVTLNYTVPGSNPIQDSAGNSAAALSSQSVTNNTSAPPPAPSPAPSPAPIAVFVPPPPVVKNPLLPPVVKNPPLPPVFTPPPVIENLPKPLPAPTNNSNIENLPDIGNNINFTKFLPSTIASSGITPAEANENIKLAYAGSATAFAINSDEVIAKIENEELNNQGVFTIRVTDSSGKEYIVPAEIITLSDNSKTIKTNTLPKELQAGTGTFILEANGKAVAKLSVVITRSNSVKPDEQNNTKLSSVLVIRKHKGREINLIINGEELYDKILFVKGKDYSALANELKISILPDRGLKLKELRVLKGQKVMVLKLEASDDVSGKKILNIITSKNQLVKTINIPKCDKGQCGNN